MVAYILKSLQQQVLQKKAEDVCKKLAHLKEEELKLQAELKGIMDKKQALRSGE